MAASHSGHSVLAILIATGPAGVLPCRMPRLRYDLRTVLLETAEKGVPVMLPPTLAAVYYDPGLGEKIDLTPQIAVFGVGGDLGMWENSLLQYDGLTGWGPGPITGGLPAQFSGGPAVVPAVPAPNRLDVFGVQWNGGAPPAPGGAIYHNVLESGQWAGWQSLGIAVLNPDGEDESFLYPPAAVSWGPNRLDVFGVSDGGNPSVGLGPMYHNWWDGADGSLQFQTTWQSLGGFFSSGPAVVSWEPHRLDVFGVGADNAMHHFWWDGTLPPPHQWVASSLGGSFSSSPPAVVSRGQNMLDVFAVWEDGTMRYKGWYSNPRTPGWSNWQSLGGALQGAPAAVSWGPNRLDVFGVSANNLSMYHNSWDGGVDNSTGDLIFQEKWDLLEPAGGGSGNLSFQFSSTPTAVSWGEGLLAVFGIGYDTTGSVATGAMYNQFDQSGQGWTGWTSMPGSYYPAP